MSSWVAASIGGIAAAPWTQTQLQELIAWQQSVALKWCECAGLPEVGAD